MIKVAEIMLEMDKNYDSVYNLCMAKKGNGRVAFIPKRKARKRD